jgi:hypothetical protein
MVEDITQEFETSWAPHPQSQWQFGHRGETREREKEKRKGRKRKKIRKKEVQTADGRVRVFPADSNCASRSVSAGRAGSKNPTVSSDFLLLFFSSYS